MLSQIGPFGTGLTFPVDTRPDPPEGARVDRVEPLKGGRATADLPALPDRASDRAQEVARANRPDQRGGTPDTVDLNPPDPDAPAGPPPAFEASILDRAREGAFDLPAPDAGSAPLVSSDPANGAPRTETADIAALLATGEGDAPPAGDEEPAADPYATPPSAEFRAAGDVATLRRIETPYDTTTVDVSR